MPAMQLVLCAETIGHLDFAAQCAFANAVGYEAVELEPRALGEAPHLLPSARRAELRGIAADHGLSIAGLHSILYEPAGLSITTPDSEVRSRTLDIMERLCGLCADLGGNYLVHGSADQRQLRPGFEDEDRVRGVDALHFGGRAAAAAGVTYVIEPIRPARDNFINTVAQAAAIAAEANNPALRTMLDCCSGAQAESEALDRLLDRWLPTGQIAHVHLNDPNRRGPGQGTLQFAGIIRALRRNNYDGAISVEPFVFEPDGCASAARAAGYVRGLLEATASD